jgi:hypothetical protein
MNELGLDLERRGSILFKEFELRKRRFKIKKEKKIQFFSIFIIINKKFYLK